MKTLFLTSALLLIVEGCGSDGSDGSAGSDGSMEAAGRADAPTSPARDASTLPRDAGGPGDASLAKDGMRPPEDAFPDVDACSNGMVITWHEPAGMAPQLDTGPLTVTPAATGNWTNGTVTFSMYSPVAMTDYGESSANLVRVPCGPGLRLLYNPSLSGGYSPVVFGTSIASPGSTTYYQRWRIRTVANWAGPRNGNGVKLCEPQALNTGSGSGSGTNDILMMWPNGGMNDQMSAMEGLQGPDGNFQDLGVNQGSIGNLTDGQWHWDERIYVAESVAGAGDGQYLAYYDGTLVAQYTDVLWLAPGGTWGIADWVVNATFGGAPTSTHPLAGDYWDFDQLYVSTK
jgi:hypothetical protein